jgi:3-oxoacyl-[acyl-carrier protein] reductase
MTVVAVVTGAAGEIGRALVCALSADGYEVHAVDLAEAVREVAAAVGGVAHVADVTDETALAPLGELPRVDVLVNGVGVWPLMTFDELTPDSWRLSTEVNLTSAYLATWVCRQGLRAAQGAVVNVTSAVAIKGHPQMIHYSAAKAGLIGLTRSLALALGPDGVRVNAVAPGLVNTDRNDEVWTPEHRQAFRSTRALPIDIGIQDVVDTVLHLASPKARAVTGQTLVVDGGTVLH